MFYFTRNHSDLFLVLTQDKVFISKEKTNSAGYPPDGGAGFISASWRKAVRETD